MQRHDFEAQSPQARVLTDEELLQTQGGNIFSDAFNWLRPVVDPLPKGLRVIWNHVREAVKAIS